jgi:outer membrane receptor for ferrienterochelin and colicins
MKKTLTLLLTLLCCLARVSAQEAPTDANIVGHVVDKATNAHLPYVNVIVKGTTIGTVTDATGHYFFKNLKTGTYEIEVKYMGYRTESRKVDVQLDKTVEINFEIAEDNVRLNGVVVSANRAETTRKLAPALVQVLDAQLFEITNSTTLSQGLCFQPGVRVENNCQNCGFQQVRINGLEGPYTQILIDSRPIFSALSGVYGLEQIPANMVERVEVMRGGGSALFGASAIAGTINIITREPLRNSGIVSHNIMAIGNTGNLDNNTSLNASLVSDDNKAGIYLFAQNRNREGYDHDDDSFTELCEIKSQTLGFRSYIKTGLYSKLTLEYHHMQEYRRGGDRLDRQPHEADVCEMTRHSIDGGGLKFDIFSPDGKHRLNAYFSAQNVNRNSYYGTDKDPNAYGTTRDITTVVGTQYTYNIDNLLFLPAALTVGAEYNNDRLHDEMLGYNSTTKQNVHITSAFLQNEWKNDTWSILVGGRFDKHNMIDHVIFSPRANIRYNPTPDINIRASYSSGFRSPQAFDEDLHIAAVGGEVAIISRADDLKEETSKSISLSADMYHRFSPSLQANFMLEGFYSKLIDAFVVEDIGWVDGILHKERRNGSGANVTGITLEAKLAYKEWLQLQAGATLQRSQYNELEKWSENPEVAAEKRMFRTPDIYGYFTALISPVKHFDISLTGTYTGEMLVQHAAGYITADRAELTPNFWDITAKMTYCIPLSATLDIDLSLGMMNIFDQYQNDFDQGPNRDSGYMYGPGLPRSCFAEVKINF